VGAAQFMPFKREGMNGTAKSPFRN
jgi:hypothetical protein